MTVAQIKRQIEYLEKVQERINDSAKVMADDLPAVADQLMMADAQIESVIEGLHDLVASPDSD